MGKIIVKRGFASDNNAGIHPDILTSGMLQAMDLIFIRNRRRKFLKISLEVLPRYSSYSQALLPMC
jgi:hypothetical protein